MQIEQEIKIVVYETINGRQPFAEWLDILDKRLMVKVSKRILRISLGNFGDYKSLGDKLYELRFSEGIRDYYSKVNEVFILLLSGGGKNNKGEQGRDIAKAREYLKDYMERENGE